MLIKSGDLRQFSCCVEIVRRRTVLIYEGGGENGKMELAKRAQTLVFRFSWYTAFFFVISWEVQRGAPVHRTRSVARVWRETAGKGIDMAPGLIILLLTQRYIAPKYKWVMVSKWFRMEAALHNIYSLRRPSTKGKLGVKNFVFGCGFDIILPRRCIAPQYTKETAAKNTPNRQHSLIIYLLVNHYADPWVLPEDHREK